MMVQHMTAAPNLSALADADRSVVATALAKKPEERFESCSAFVSALIAAGRDALVPACARSAVPGPPSSRVFDPSATGSPTRGPGGGDETLRHDASVIVTPAPQPPRRRVYKTPPEALTPAPAEQMAGRPAPFGLIQLDRIQSAIPVAWLKGGDAPRPTLPATQLVGAVLRAAEGEPAGKVTLGAVNRESDGVWGCRFLTTIDPRLARVKLDLLSEECRVKADSQTPGRVVFRLVAPVPAPSGLFAGFSKKPKPAEAGFEVVVDLPERAGPGAAEVGVRGGFFGSPPPEFLRTGEKIIVRLLDGIRRTLNNVEERRKHPRINATFPLTLYPFHSDGRLEAPIRSICQDVSGGGLAAFCPSKPPAKYAYVVFEDVPELAGLALLFQIVRSVSQHDEVLVTGRYRLDFEPRA
jgi:hypothetical protein